MRNAGEVYRTIEYLVNLAEKLGRKMEVEADMYCDPRWQRQTRKLLLKLRKVVKRARLIRSQDAQTMCDELDLGINRILGVIDAKPEMLDLPDLIPDLQEVGKHFDRAGVALSRLSNSM
jgi:hypothetical protein